MSWFGFWNRESAEAKAEREQREHQQAAAAAALKAGGIPPEAKHRLHELQQSGNFTSGLGIGEMLLVREAGFKPLGQVMGSSFYHFAQIMVPVRQSAALPEVERAQREARHLALTRLQHEAAALGASGVVGVRFKMHNREWSQGVQEFSALGTAVRAPDGPATVPWLSTLSGQDLWKLHRAGYRPCGLAWGVAVEYVYPNYDTWRFIEGFRSSRQNAEIQQYGAALQAARRRAEHALHLEAQALGASGVLGMIIEPELTRVRVQNEEDKPTILVKYVAMGTCIVATDAPTHSAPTIVRNLTDAPASRQGRAYVMATVLDDDDDDDDDSE